MRGLPLLAFIRKLVLLNFEFYNHIHYNDIWRVNICEFICILFRPRRESIYKQSIKDFRKFNNLYIVNNYDNLCKTYQILFIFMFFVCFVFFFSDFEGLAK